MLGGVPILNLEIAHIRALESGGKRYDPSWSDAARNSFGNLILLCTAHHKLVDGVGSDRYSVGVLESWKAAREADGIDALAGLNQLTEEKLVRMMATAQGEFLDRVGPALDEFGRTAPELASLLRILTDELADPRVHGFGISEDGIAMLARSADILVGLEDYAHALLAAAERMGNIQDGAAMLLEAAEHLQAAAGRIMDARY
jgi:hypothetical protein